MEIQMEIEEGKEMKTLLNNSSIWHQLLLTILVQHFPPMINSSSSNLNNNNNFNNKVNIVLVHHQTTKINIVQTTQTQGSLSTANLSQEHSHRLKKTATKTKDRQPLQNNSISNKAHPWSLV
jgi:hypothetical protein